MNKRTWTTLLLAGLTGQFAWTLENMYFNVYLYNTISKDSSYIAWMVAASAITAALTTLLMGALSDRVGKRKIFITLGYVLWGITIISFGFIDTGLFANVTPVAKASAMAATLVIVMDCVMTFFGSTANDAAFNAYVTDVTESHNRGRVESVLAVLPLMSMLVIFGLFDPLTQRGEWRLFFTIFGVAVIFAGLLAIPLMKDPKLEKRSGGASDVIYGFRPSVIRQNAELYIALTALFVYSTAVQVFFPYLIVYMQTYLGFGNYAIVLGVVLIAASIVSVVMGPMIDKAGKLKFLLPSVAVMLVGLVLMFIARSFAFVMIAGSVMMSGYMLIAASLSAVVRDKTPTGHAGLFQGVRMIFAVMLPMIFGPFIGSAVIKSSGGTYVELGVVKDVPTPAIFLAAAIVLAISVIPLVILKRRADK